MWPMGNWFMMLFENQVKEFNFDAVIRQELLKS